MKPPISHRPFWGYKLMLVKYWLLIATQEHCLQLHFHCKCLQTMAVLGPRNRICTILTLCVIIRYIYSDYNASIIFPRFTRLSGSMKMPFNLSTTWEKSANFLICACSPTRSPSLGDVLGTPVEMNIFLSLTLIFNNSLCVLLNSFVWHVILFS